MNLVELTEFLVKNLVNDPDSVSVKQIDDDDYIQIAVIIKDEDMGSIIGRDGKTANAIRTIVQASAHIHSRKNVRIDITSI